MNQESVPESKPIRRALLSVSDKSGLLDLAQTLVAVGAQIISTGGTARALREAGINVRDVSEVTGFPEMMNGRIKTLHPRVHGGLLALRDDQEHMRHAAEHDIEMIDMLVVNLYPFEQTIRREKVQLAEAIEQIDIGGPAMIRSAAKNYRDVAVVTAPDYYDEIVDELRRTNGALSLATRGRLACAAFDRTAAYDNSISTYLSTQIANEKSPRAAEHNDGSERSDSTSSDFSGRINLALNKLHDLRYGENPHQSAALYEGSERGGIAHAQVLSGKEMSYNNYVDADAAWNLVTDFSEPACAIIKHTNPAGVALAASVEVAYRRALATDPVSAFGGIVAFNQILDAPTAKALTEIFTEVIIAPAYDAEALTVLRGRKNLRVLRVDASETNANENSTGYEYKQISGGFLAQTIDARQVTANDLRVVTKRAPTDKEIDDLLFAWTVCKHTKSNAIVYARDKATIGVGAGQMSRVDSVRLGAERARNMNLEVADSVLASDAFFPFRDGLDAAAQHGITAVIQPGGSVRDEEVIAAADEHNIAMVFTGVRHFKH